MANQTVNKNKFIYAIAGSGDSDIYGVQGVDKGNVYFLKEAGVTAVVSDLSRSRVRPDRRNIMAHREVLEFMMGNSSAVLPMRFGVVANSLGAVRKLLESNSDKIRGQLQRVDNKVEMGLRVTWDVDNIYDYFVAIHPLLRQARDATLGVGRNPSREEKIELGRIYHHLMADERRRHLDRVSGVLEGYCDELVAMPTKTESEVMSLACLIARDKQQQFEQGVFEAAKSFDNNYLFNYTGPWAPHSFVDLELQMPYQMALS